MGSVPFIALCKKFNLVIIFKKQTPDHVLVQTELLDMSTKSGCSSNGVNETKETMSHRSMIQVRLRYTPQFLA